jgi:multiple sugar transport system permease protein
LLDAQHNEVAGAVAAPAIPRAGRKQSDWIAKAAAKRGMLLSIPAWVMIAPLFFLPLAVSLRLSFYDKSLGLPVEPSFVGFENYRTDVFTSTFAEALFKTLVILVLGLLIQFPLGIAIALALHRRFRGRGIFRTLILLPMLLTPVAVGLMWRFMYNPELGIINWWITQLGLPPVDWLGSPWPAVVAVTLVDSWQATSLVVLMVLAGLSALDTAPTEAARVDGASSWQLFRYITFPALLPILLVTLMLRVIDGFKIFDIIFILTRGGPGTATQSVSLLDYNVAFTFLATSRASAIGVVLVLLTLPLYFLWRKVAKLQEQA